MPKSLLAPLTILMLLISFAKADFTLPSDSRQLIVGLAEDWESSHVTLQKWERNEKGAWKKAGDSWKGRLGPTGLAWGLGLHPNGLDGAQKAEGDKRAPAGVFKVYDAFGYAPTVKKKASLNYRQVTPADLWVDDPASPYYNQHRRMDHAAPRTEWEKKQQMKQGDPAHALKLFIAHNAAPHAKPGKGSAIFFHVWRDGGTKATAGCTTMAENRLRELVAWVDPSVNPLFVLLPQSAYEQFRAKWQLP